MVDETEVAYYLRLLFEFWHRVPTIALEYPNYDWYEREDYLIDDYSLARDRFGSLEKLQDKFTLEEKERYQELLALIAKNQHFIDEMRRIADTPHIN